MKNREILFAIKIFVLVIFFALAGCIGVSPVLTPTGVTLAASPISPISTSLAATSTPTKESIPTRTPTLTKVPISTPTIQPTATETPFAIPTPPGNDTNEQVLWLLETNNGCKLPCWWGITPGQTEWKAAEKILTIFDANIYAASASGLDYYNPTINLPFGPYEINQIRPIYTIKNGIVEKIETQVLVGDSPSEYLAQYALPALLTAYGQPGEVWLSTYPSAFEEGDLPFFAVLFYPEQGILAAYDTNGKEQGNLVQGCPQEKPLSRLVLLPPGLDNTFEETVSKTSGLGQRDYLPLEEATGMNVMTFYEIFKDPGNVTCLETSAELWH